MPIVNSQVQSLRDDIYANFLSGGLPSLLSFKVSLCIWQVDYLSSAVINSLSFLRGDDELGPWD